jgi:hypothetical protein
MEGQKCMLELAPEFPLWMLTGEEPNIFYSIGIDPFPKAGKAFISGSTTDTKQREHFINPTSNDLLYAKQALELGVSIINTGSAYYLHYNDALQFKKLLSDGKFFGTVNGKDYVWKLNFWGNQHIGKNIVSNVKSKFLNTATHLANVENLKLLKLTKHLGTFGNALAIGEKSVDYIKNPNGEHAFDLSATTLFVVGGVAASKALLTGAAVAGVSVGMAPIILGGFVVISGLELLTDENGAKNLYNYVSKLF